MKKLIIVLMVCASFTSQAQIDNLNILSADWMRIGVRNGATNGTDAAVYNPAGLTSFENGIHVNLSNQSLFRNPSHSYDLGFGDGRKTFKQNGSDPVLPSLYISYNKNKWAFFGAAYIAGGGATMNYPTGSLTTDLIGLSAVQSTGGAYTNAIDQRLKASSTYFSLMAGSAYAVSDKFSVSLAIRSISAANKAEGGMTLTASPIDLPDQPLGISYEENASGAGVVIGLNYQCNENLNLSWRYESKTTLNFKTKTITDDFGLTTDGELNRRDLPAVSAIGAAYSINDKVKTYFDFNYYFQQDADWGKSTVATNEKPYSSLAGDAYGFGAGIEYKISPKFTASMGGAYTKYDYSDKAGYYTYLGTYEVMHDSNTNLNTGFAYQATKKMRFTAGYMHVMWATDNVKALIAQPMDVDVTINNSMNAVGLGLQMSF